MLDFLKRLRQKSDGQKEAIAIGTSALLTLFIASLWLSSNPLSYPRLADDFSSEGLAAVRDGSASLPALSETAAPKARSEVTPLETLQEALGEAFASTKDLFEALRSAGQK